MGRSLVKHVSGLHMNDSSCMVWGTVIRVNRIIGLIFRIFRALFNVHTFRLYLRSRKWCRTVQFIIIRLALPVALRNVTGKNIFTIRTFKRHQRGSIFSEMNHIQEARVHLYPSKSIKFTGTTAPKPTPGLPSDTVHLKRIYQPIRLLERLRP